MKIVKFFKSGSVRGMEGLDSEFLPRPKGIPGKPRQFVPIEQIPDDAPNPEERLIAREAGDEENEEARRFLEDEAVAEKNKHPDFFRDERPPSQLQNTANESVESPIQNAANDNVEPPLPGHGSGDVVEISKIKKEKGERNWFRETFKLSNGRRGREPRDKHAKGGEGVG